MDNPVMEGCVLLSILKENHVIGDTFFDISELKLTSTGRNQLSYIRCSIKDQNVSLPEAGNICSTCFDLLARRPAVSCKSSWHKSGGRKTKLNNVTAAEYFTKFKTLGFLPNDAICLTCKTNSIEPEDKTSSESEDETSSESEDEFEQPSEKKQALSNLNTSRLAIPGLETIDFERRNLPGQANLVKIAVEEYKEKVFSSFRDCGVPVNSDDIELKKLKRDSKDLYDLMNLLKTRIQGCTKDEQKCLLTLCPPSWSKEFAAEFFDVPKNLIKSSRKKLKEVGSILPATKIKQGRKLSLTVQTQVQAFFNDDQVSRCAPGKGDVLTVKNKMSEIREKRQKRYLLANMIELYQHFKEQNPDMKIGKSSFFSLRPKECLSHNSKGFHNVCLCVYHENAKLLCSAIGINSITPILELLVCDMKRKDCAFRRCDSCATNNSILKQHIEAEVIKTNKEVIKFKRWLTTDGAQFTTDEKPSKEFVDFLLSELVSLVKHHFISKTQQRYFVEKKSNLKPGEIIIWGDFAENYSPLTQDAIQSDHWRHQQITLHPFMVYMKVVDHLFAFSYCIISDSTQHDTHAVVAFEKAVLEDLSNTLDKLDVPKINYVNYFSDGCAAQYKNRKNFYNLYFHEKDLGVPAEWNFFATAHGKGPCDGNGGTTKRLARLASLRGQQILTALEMFDWCKKNIHNIQYLYVSSDEISATAEEFGLEARDDLTQTINGTQKAHRFVPVQNKIVAYETSFDTSHLTVKEIEPTVESIELPNVQIDPDSINDFVLTVYDDEWYISKILDVNSEEEEVEVGFYKGATKARGTTFVMESNKAGKQVTCWLPYGHVLKKLKTPVWSQRGRKFQIPTSEQEEFDNLLQTFISI